MAVAGAISATTRTARRPSRHPRTVTFIPSPVVYKDWTTMPSLRHLVTLFLLRRCQSCQEATFHLRFRRWDAFPASWKRFRPGIDHLHTPDGPALEEAGRLVLPGLLSLDPPAEGAGILLPHQGEDAPTEAPAH